MYFYKVTLLGSPLEPLTYQSEVIITLGTKVIIPLQKREKEGVVLSETNKPTFATENIIKVLPFSFSILQRKTAHFIASYYICSLGDALNLMVPFSDEKVDDRTLTCKQKKEVKLSSLQTQAYIFLKQHQIALLFGDTGSGKTEIYMYIFAQILKKGKRSLFLMPEIALTPQIANRLEEYFTESVVVWHSKLTPKQKRTALEKIYSGKAKIIAGARSALFLPIKDLEIIVVDEEHDESYKSSSRPRYNARDIAIYMGKIYDIPIVLGSATPSLNSYVKFPHFRMKGGYINAKKEFIYEKMEESLSPMVLAMLSEILQKKEQAIMFIPTRANFKYLICSECGESIKCSFCSVGMSVHHKSHALKCHYCNFTQPIPQICPSCHKAKLSSARLGTAEAVVELRKYFSNSVIEQFDKDTITTANKLKKMLKRFNEKEIDILVGTQMLSKGHDYHGVSLAVILGMDHLLNMSDYRAREKALSLLIQVAGRSGRGGNAKVLVQTFHQDFFHHYIGRYEQFLEDEKIFREGLYPPYKKLCRVLFSHKNGMKAQEAMWKMEASLRCFPHVEIVSAKRCAIERVANKYRFEILLRGDKATDIIQAIRATQPSLAEVDMDPIEFA